MVATDILWHLLVVVEHGVRLAIPADDGVQPELLHEEDLVGEVLGAPCVSECVSVCVRERTSKCE